MKLATTVTVPIDDVKPYWRNPRRVTEDAVNQLVASIRDYGYQQPIVVDPDMVIVVGHTRYAALRRLDVTEVPVIIADHLTTEQLKQYRLIDNKVAELTSWDYTQLMDELEAIDTSIAAAFFPEISGAQIDQFSEDEATIAREWDKVETSVDFVCPSCFHPFTTEVTKEALLTGVIKAS
jgi:hypothetical protein